MRDRCLKERLSDQVQTDSVIGQDALQLLVDDVYSLVRWAVKGSKFVGKVTRLTSRCEESYHETEHDTVAADYLHD